MAWGLALPEDREKIRNYRPPRMTDEQMKALEKFITRSKDASDFAKRVIIWLLRQTDNLTHRVALSLRDDDPFEATLVDEMSYGVHDMASSNCSTHIDTFFQAMGTEVRLSSHGGVYEVIAERMFNHEVAGGTIWVSFVYYDHEAELLASPTHEELAAIKLWK